MNINNFKGRVWVDDEKRFRYCDYIPTMGFVWGMDGTPLEIGENYIQLWTGLRDVHGNDIYEGDVIKYHSYEDWGDIHGAAVNNFVFYESRIAGYVVRGTIAPHEKYVGAGLQFYAENCTVIGNMFDTPELK